MYNALLSRVIKVIEETVGKTPQQNSTDDMINMMFNPKVYEAQREERRVRADRANKLVVAATGLAAVGELYHIAKRSGIVDKLTKK